MARPITEIDKEILESAISDWRAGVLTKTEIAKRHAIPYDVLKRRLKGIAQDGISTTRALVAAQVAGIPNKEIDAAVSDKVGQSVAVASEAMLGADAVFRAAIRLSKEMLESDAAKALSPKELRDYTSTAKEAMEGVRRVRELDGPPDNPLKDLFAQLGTSAALRPKADA